MSGANRPGQAICNFMAAARLHSYGYMPPWEFGPLAAAHRRDLRQMHQLFEQSLNGIPCRCRECEPEGLPIADAILFAQCGQKTRIRLEDC